MLKKIFSSKTNIVLIICTLLVIAGLTFMAFSLFGKKDVLAIDFSNLKENEIQEWATNNLDDGILKIEYAYDEIIEKDKVISQSVKEGEVIIDSLIIVISNGRDPDLELELPVINDELSLDVLKKWLSDNGFVDVEYIYVLDEGKAFGTIISYSSPKAKRSAKLTVNVSSGDQLENIETTMINLTSYNRKMVNDWAGQYALNVKISYKFSDVNEDYVVSYSPSEGTALKGGDEINVVLSQGPGVLVKNLKGLSKSEAAKWLSDNGLNVTYTNQYSDSVAEGMVISTSPAADYRVSSGSTVKVVISLGEEPSAIIPDNLLGISENDFINKLKELGFTNYTKSSTSYYSKTIQKGSVYSYDDGKYPLDSNINYALSNGPYVFNDGEYNNKTKSQVSDLIKKYNKLNAQISTSVSYKEIETSDSSLYGKTSACSFSNSQVSCNIYIKKLVNLPNYVGTKNNPCGSASSCLYNDINYKIKTTHSNDEEGTIIKQSVASGQVEIGTEVTLTVSLGKEAEKTAYIISYDDFLSYNTSSSDETIAGLKSYFKNAGFSNVSYKKVESTLTVGVVVSVSVNGNKSYDPGEYPLSTPIVVEVCDSRKN